MKRVLLVLMSAIFLIGLFGCGEANMNPGITSVDLVDSTQTQQRWLRLPASSVVINPDSYTNGSETGDFLNMPLNIGILDETGAVKTTINDAMFFMETNSANGKGGVVLFTGSWSTANINFNVPKGQLEYEAIGETGVKFWINPTITTNAVMMTFKKPVEMDFDQDVILNLNVLECVGMISLKGALEPQGDIRTTGPLSYNLTQFSGYTGKKKLSLGVYAIEPGNSITIDNYEIRQIPKGFRYGKEVLTTWAPYALTSSISFENGTSMSVKDVFVTENTIVRNITGVAQGNAALAGKYNGTLTFDSKTGCINIAADGYKYTIATKRKTNFRVYATEDDMKNDKNAITENYPTSGFWFITFGAINLEDTASISMTIDKDNTMVVEDMNVAAKEYLLTQKKFEEALAARIEAWDTYMMENVLTPDLILNIPAVK